MKRLIITAAILAVFGFLLYSLGHEDPVPLAQAVQSGEIVRLHVIASGDSSSEQDTKLAVRDAVIALCGPSLEKASSAVESATLLREMLPEIEKTAAATARSRGESGPVSATFAVSAFPEKSYAGVVVPAGEYQALKIVLGEGNGANWWCVMYPPLCFIGEEAIDPGEKVEVKFESVIAKWLRGRG